MRSLPEWQGKTDDTPIPPRVKLRIFERYGGKCNLCTRRIGDSLHSAFDHIDSLIAGGGNRETNIQLLCFECHGAKTKTDVREKSIVYNKKAKRLKLKNRRLIPGSRGSGVRKTMAGKVWRE